MLACFVRKYGQQVTETVKLAMEKDAFLEFMG